MTVRVVPAADPDANWFADDPALHAILTRYVPGNTLKQAEERLRALGSEAPRRLDPLARAADRHGPILHRRTPDGERVDDVEFHPSYRRLQEAARAHRVFTLPWLESAPRVLGFAFGYLYAQAESGYYCPACMTDGAAFVLTRHAPPEVRDRYVPRLVSASAEDGWEGAMYLTEKGGGSDVGGGTATTARPAEDGSWHLTGEKWFASNCVAEVALALARMPDGDGGTRGLGLFVVPRFLPDGSRNPGIRIERLKEKLGVRSMPTGEVLLEDAYAELVAPAPTGFRAMAEMVNLSRLYNAVASVAVARRALREGQRVGRAREAFGKPVGEHPLYLKQLTALTVDVEGAVAFTFDTAHLFDRFAGGDAEAGVLLRVLTPCAKSMTARLSVDAASAACEFLGGNGYIEDYVTPRLLRDAQVLPIWEGTSNVQALEFLKTCNRAPAVETYRAHVKGQLEAAATEGSPAKTALATTRAALDVLLEEMQVLASKADAVRAEAAASRLLARAYHVHAAALLTDLAANAGDGERCGAVADLYAARHLAPDLDAGERALEESLSTWGARIAYPL